MRRFGWLGLIALVASCSSDVGSRALAINDPLDLIDDVQGPLRLFVLDAMMYTCDPTTGLVTPEVPDVAEGMVDDAVADLTLAVDGSRAMTEVEVPPGMFTILVRGKGTDPVSGRMDVFIATGCATQPIDSGETREVPITLLPIFGSGVCGDGTLSPDEQCEDGNTADGDGCSSACRAEPFDVNSTRTGIQNRPQVGGGPGQRWFIGFDSENSTSLVKVLEADGSTVTMPAALNTDGDIDDALADVGAGAQLLSDFAVHTSGRVGWAFVDFFGGPSDIRVAFTNRDRNPEGPSALVVDGMATNPRIAFDDGGAAMVVYEDMGSGTGMSAQVFAAGSTTPALGAPIEIGAAGGSGPVVDGGGAGFVIAYAAGGNVQARRFDAAGSPQGDAIDVGAGTHPAVGVNPDGSFLVAWEDASIDGAGPGIGFRHFGADGSPSADAAALNTTTGGAQTAPVMATSADGYVVVFESDGGIRARMVSSSGEPIPNRESPPTTADFQVSAAGTEPSVDAGGDSAFMAVWTEANEVRGLLHPLP